MVRVPFPLGCTVYSLQNSVYFLVISIYQTLITSYLVRRCGPCQPIALDSALQTLLDQFKDPR